MAVHVLIPGELYIPCGMDVQDEGIFSQDLDKVTCVPCLRHLAKRGLNESNRQGRAVPGLVPERLGQG